METERVACEDGSCERSGGICPPCIILWAVVGGYLLVSWLFF
jgi:hypothetical protein